MEYAILDGDGICLNRVLWDGESSWRPPDGCTAVPDPDRHHQPPRIDQPPSDPLDVLTEEQKAAIVALLQPDSSPVRARDENGQFIPDDPSTPDVDEAWV